MHVDSKSQSLNLCVSCYVDYGHEHGMVCAEHAMSIVWYVMHVYVMLCYVISCEML